MSAEPRRPLLLVFACWLLLSVPVTAGPALILDINGAIGPATSDYVKAGFAQAASEEAELIILRMDTPGGLDAAMRDIVKEVLGSRIPVVGYVAPSGARAASAGTYILQATHVAAMAPATTLGSATPVQIGGLPSVPEQDKPQQDEPQQDKSGPGSGKTGNGDGEGPDEKADRPAAPQPKTAIERKIVNDAAAYLRGLAILRGRNADWAEQAVRSAANLPAAEALQQQVIDLVANDVAELIAQLDGRKIKIQGSEITLKTTGLSTKVVEADWRTELLGIITNPNIAYVLLLIGVYGLIYELANPGAILPGVSGAIALILALYAFQALPVNYAGLALLLLGIGFMILEAFMPSFGALGVGGAIAFIAGSVMLFRDDAGQIGVAVPVIATFAVLSMALFVGLIGYAVKTRRKAVVSGAEEMVGSIGEALEDFQGAGRIRVHSESWTAYSDRPIRRGQRVRIVDMNGLKLKIEEVKDD